MHAGCRVLLVETTSGLLAGAFAYRMRGQGLILALYGSQQPHLEMVNYFNLGSTNTAIIQASSVFGFRNARLLLFIFIYFLV